MNERERFIETMTFGSPDRIPNHELGLWGQTVERWIGEGMPTDALKGNFFEGEPFFKLDRREFVNVNVNMIPPFEAMVIEEDERTILYRDEQGILRKALKEGTVRGTRPSMDLYIDFPVKTREDFHRIKERYDPFSPGRYPSDWEEKAKRWERRDCPLCLLANGTFGFYSMLRRWMGTVNLSYAFYDTPELVEEMLDFLCDFFIETTRRAVKELDIDYFNFFEDFAGKGGPLLSPQIFRRLFLPRYKRVIEFLRGNGINIITLDSDGNIEVLIPLLIEVGVTGIWPLEVASGMEPAKLRKEYGSSLALSGGIDKRALAKNRESIRRELLKVASLIEQGGYIPTVDHTVPPDVSYSNFLYYLELKLKLLEGVSI